MKDVLNELEKYKYHGEALKPHLEPLIRKVEKSDYIAAVEALMRLKDGIKKPEVERDV
jgi:predicted DNA-binding protein